MFRIVRSIRILNHHRSYHKKVIDHYENPRNVGSFNTPDFDCILKVIDEEADLDAVGNTECKVTVEHKK